LFVRVRSNLICRGLNFFEVTGVALPSIVFATVDTENGQDRLFFVPVAVVGV
jgi:hypothetical protein